MAKVSLTAETAQNLEFYWQLVGDKITDERSCEKLEISWAQFHGWLKEHQAGREGWFQEDRETALYTCRRRPA